jgi:hypothetical protein
LAAIMSPRARNLLWAGLLALLLIPLFVGISPRLRYDPLLGTLGSRYHIGLFLIVTLVLYYRSPLRGRLTLVVLVSLLLGAASELLQTRFGRSAALADWILDAQGVGFAVCWIWFRDRSRRVLPLAGAILLAGLVLWPLRHVPVTVQEFHAAQARFPVLEDFERPNALALWAKRRKHGLTREPVEGRGHVLQIYNDGTDRWPGATTGRLPWDWSDYAELHVDCRLIAPSPDSLRVSVRIDDRAGPDDADWAFEGFTVGHEWRTLVVRLDELVTRNRGRPVAGSEVFSITIYAVRNEPGTIAFQIDDLRLVPGAGTPPAPTHGQ